MGEKRGMQALEAWCRQVTAGYNGVNVTNMTSSWRDGLAFCALIHHFRPDLIDFDSLNAENILHNNNLAFTVAEQQLGIPALLDPEDMVKFIPDRLSIMTYLSQFYQVLAATKSKGQTKKTGDVDSGSFSDSSINSSFENVNQKRTPEKIQKEFARQLPVERRSPRTSEVCSACHNPVFLAERLMVSGRLHHRVCFRCARCNSQLSLANYYETETGQYCCETCPDEVKNPAMERAEPPQEDNKVIVCAEVRIEPEPIKTMSSASSIEKKLFLESLVDDTSDTTSLKFIDEAPPDVNTTTEVPKDNCESSDHANQNTPNDPEIQEVLETEVNISNETKVEIATHVVDNERSDQQESQKEAVDETAKSMPNELSPEVAGIKTPFDEDDEEDRVSQGEADEERSLDEVQIEEKDAIESPTEERISDESVVKEKDAIESPTADRISDESKVEEKSLEESPAEEKSASDTPVEATDKSGNDDYPDDLNPFDEESEEESSTNVCPPISPRKVIPAPKISLNPFETDDEDDEIIEKPPLKIPPERPPPPVTKTPTIKPSPSPKKRPAPAPPMSLSPAIQTRSPTLSERSSTRRKKSAPAPPPPADAKCSPCESPAIEKAQKEMANLQTQALNKDSHGQWKRKKGPAPPRPLPQKRHLRKLPVQSIQQELNDIEIKQLELERQGVTLEQSIRGITESDDCETYNGGAHVEEMILQLFDLVNEKNELLRRQSELMYIRRQQRLEEEHVELEFQIRCLIEKPAAEKTDDDRLKEEELIERLVQVVHRRAEIVDCLELDRRRQAEEDQSIQKHLDDYNTRHNEPSEASGTETTERQPKPKLKGFKAIQAPIKLMSKDKLTKRKKKKEGASAEEDTENQNSKLKPSTSDQSSEHHPNKDKEKKKTKSWFTK